MILLAVLIAPVHIPFRVHRLSTALGIPASLALVYPLSLALGTHRGQHRAGYTTPRATPCWVHHTAGHATRAVQHGPCYTGRTARAVTWAVTRACTNTPGINTGGNTSGINTGGVHVRCVRLPAYCPYGVLPVLDNARVPSLPTELYLILSSKGKGAGQARAATVNSA